ncbi:MAG: transporter substrate-binding domain-containing protein [Burkholderiales bacterium]|nr:transporter substrate-binding domain-containing protein [Burkholderiales bacterium]
MPLLIRELRNDSGEVVPIREDIRQLLAYFEREAHLRFEIRYYPMNRLLSNAKAGEGIVFGLSKTSERLHSLRFSEPIYANYVWLVTRQDADISFNEIGDLKGKTIGVVRGVSYGDEFEQQKHSMFTVEDDASSYVARLRKLTSKRMDIMLFGDRRSDPKEVELYLRKLQQLDQTRPPEKSETEFKVLNKPLRNDELHFAAALHKHDAVMDQLNKAILTGKTSGELKRILLPPK